MKMLQQVKSTFPFDIDTFIEYILPSELHVKTVKYFKSIERVQDEVDRAHAELKAVTSNGQRTGSLHTVG
jgi:hypothetical protein